MAHLQSDHHDVIVQAIENDSSTQLIGIFKNYSKLELMTKLWTPNEQGETLLILAIKRKRFNVIDLLVKKLRECVRDKKCRSLCLSTFCQIQTNDQVSIVEVMEYLIDPWLLEPRTPLAGISLELYQVQFDCSTRKNRCVRINRLCISFYSSEKSVQGNVGTSSRTAMLERSHGSSLLPR